MAKKLNWTFDAVRADGKDQHAVCACGSYLVAQVEGGYGAVYADGVNDPVAVVEAGSFGQAYNGAVRHHAKNHPALAAWFEAEALVAWLEAEAALATA
jgi:hypothetical protein